MTPRTESRRATLDPALTLLALRGRRDPEAWLPFLEPVTRRARWWRLGVHRLAVLTRRRRRADGEPEGSAPRARGR